MNPEQLLTYLAESFNFLVDEWGLHLSERRVTQYGPKLNYTSAQFTIEVFYDMREKHLQIRKLVLGKDNEVMRSISLSALLKGKELDYIKKLMSPSNFDELQRAVPEWKKFLKSHKDLIFDIIYLEL